MSKYQLVLGPVLFNWGKEKLERFYQDIAAEPAIDSVCVGEVICAKREKFSYEFWLPIIELLLDSGKQVRFSTLSVVTNNYESNINRKICTSNFIKSDCNFLVEVNDTSSLGALNHVPFSVGQLFNCYNESTVKFLQNKGARSITLPVELSHKAVNTLSNTANIPIGVQVFGRMPLALSVRCYQARAYGLHKQNCDIICSNDLDGLSVDTLEDKPLFAVNGLQTLSHSYSNLLDEINLLKDAGVQEFRVSPQDTPNMPKICRLFRDTIDGNNLTPAADQQLKELLPSIEFSNGYWYGQPGMERINVKNIA